MVEVVAVVVDVVVVGWFAPGAYGLAAGASVLVVVVEVVVG